LNKVLTFCVHYRHDVLRRVIRLGLYHLVDVRLAPFEQLLSLVEDADELRQGRGAGYVGVGEGVGGGVEIIFIFFVLGVEGAKAGRGAVGGGVLGTVGEAVGGGVEIIFFPCFSARNRVY
jgi:hypothetical protein